MYYSGPRDAGASALAPTLERWSKNADKKEDLGAQRTRIAAWLDRERGLQLKDPTAPILPNTQPTTFLGFRVSRSGVLPGPKMKRRLKARLSGAETLAHERLVRGLIAYRGVLSPF